MGLGIPSPDQVFGTKIIKSADFVEKKGFEIDQDRLSDTKNAELVVEKFGDKIRFDHRRRRWLIWEGHIWNPDTDQAVTRFVVETMRELYRNAESITDTKNREKVAKWAIQSESKQKVDYTLGMLKTLLPVADRGENWDKNTMLLACPNGIIDLATGQLREGKPEDRITMTSSIKYDLTAKCPRWEQFIDEIFLGDKELTHYIQKALGYSLTGDVSEQSAFFCYGAGANGKSVLFKTIRKIVKDYGIDAPSSLLKRNMGASSSNDLASIENKRYLVSSETLSTSKINEERLKALTGGDDISARFLYSEYFTFTPTCHIWLFMNHKPRTEDDSFGFWRRIKLIPFKAKFTGDKADPKLLEKLELESEGILKWLVDGCLLWQKEGLKPTPRVVSEETETYQAENDDLFEFLLFLTNGQKIEEIKTANVYSKYLEWVQQQGLKKEDIMTRNAFGRRMSDKFERTRKNDGVYYKSVEISTQFVPECSNSTPISINPPREEYKGSFKKTTPITTLVHAKDETLEDMFGNSDPLEDELDDETGRIEIK